MIIRVFTPTIHPGKSTEFESFLRDTAQPLVAKQSGLIAQHAGKSRAPASTEYVYVTVWEDVESIRAFAGERSGGRHHARGGAHPAEDPHRALRRPAMSRSCGAA